MAKMLKGIDVILYERVQSGTDALNRPTYTETATTVENVLVGEPTSDDVVRDSDLYGKKLAYTLAIPKGDTHNWEGCKVEFFNQTFQVYGYVTQGIEDMIPLDWNKKVKVEHYG
jgi:hypothetical protein